MDSVEVHLPALFAGGKVLQMLGTGASILKRMQANLFISLHCSFWPNMGMQRLKPHMKPTFLFIITIQCTLTASKCHKFVWEEGKGEWILWAFPTYH